MSHINRITLYAYKTHDKSIL